MPEIQFEPSKTTLRDMLRNDNYYIIPRFQRPFSWDADNFEAFWEDLTKDESSGYFIGPMIVWQETNSHIARVVDGQQRLTVIMMMLCAIRDKFAGLGKSDLAAALHKLIEKQDDDGESRYSLEVEDGTDYFPRAILQESPNKELKPKTEEEKNLDKINTNIRKQISRFTNEEREGWEDRLKNLRKQLLDLRVILIANDNEDDAYTIFETINSRGKNLEVIDLLKNHLLSKLPGSGNKKADDPKAKWDSMRKNLEATGEYRRLNPNRYLQHWWLSRVEYKSEQHLFSRYKEKIFDAPSAQFHLNELEIDSLNYRHAMTPDSAKWDSSLYVGAQALKGLELFGVVQPAPLLLALVRAVRSEKLTHKQFNNTLRVIESFHYQYTIVSRQSSSGGVTQMYAKAARDLHAARNEDKPRDVQAKVLRDITRKLFSRMPTREQFILAFLDRFTYTSDYTTDKRFIQYTLERFTRHEYKNSVIQNPSIEHLLPQVNAKTDPKLASAIGSLGNLLLVDRAANAEDLSDKSYQQKKAILQTSSPLSDTAHALSNDTWGPEEIAQRTRRMAEMAYDEIWEIKKPH